MSLTSDPLFIAAEQQYRFETLSSSPRAIATWQDVMPSRPARTRPGGRTPQHDGLGGGLLRMFRTV